MQFGTFTVAQGTGQGCLGWWPEVASEQDGWEMAWHAGRELRGLARSCTNL